jgi:hypothetical protein
VFGFLTPKVVIALLLALAVGYVAGGAVVGSASAGEDTETQREADKLLVRIDNAQLCHLKAERRFGAGIADLEETMLRISEMGVGPGFNAHASAFGLTVQVDASDDGSYYTLRITGPGDVDLSMAREARGFADLPGPHGRFPMHDRCIAEQP